MSVVKSFSSWHAIELTFAWSFQVWNPIIQFPFEWNRIEFLTLFKPEIFGTWGTFLRVAARVPFGRSSTITILALSRLHQDSSSTSSWTVLVGYPISPFSWTLVRISVINERKYTYKQDRKQSNHSLQAKKNDYLTEFEKYQKKSHFLGNWILIPQKFKIRWFFKHEFDFGKLGFNQF